MGFDVWYRSVTAMNFPCCLPKESFKCICTVLIPPFFIGVGCGGKTFLLLFWCPEHKFIKMNCHPFNIHSLYKGYNSKVSSSSESISEWCIVLAIRSWSGSCCGLMCKKGFELLGERQAEGCSKNRSLPLTYPFYPYSLVAELQWSMWLRSYIDSF